MAILINEEQRLFTLHTAHSTYQMKADRNNRLIHTFYGGRMDETDLYGQICPMDRGFAPNPPGVDDRAYSMDTLPQEYSTFGTGDFRITGLKVRDEKGSRTANLIYAGFETGNGLLPIEGLPAAYAEDGSGEHLSVYLKDEENGLTVILHYGILEETDVILRSAELLNEGEQTLWIEKAASLCLDVPFGDLDLITFYGRHAMERNIERRRIPHGVSSVGSVRGHSSHHYNPFAILCAPSATENTGEAYGVAFAYSGEFLMEAEKDQTNATRFLCGLHPDDFTWKLSPGEHLPLPQVILTYSDEGFGKLSRNLHRTITDHICRGEWKEKDRPILLNNWEGTYFDFTGEKLLSMAKTAKDLGAELFVLDDGWFGKRDDDLSGLGDWFANEKKLGCSLKELGERIVAGGIDFGLWVEPEAISEDSDLYRAHPDWAVAVPGRRPTLGRHQLILDFSREDVCNYITERLSAILEEVPISYIKWDMNRSLCDKFSNGLPADQQGEFAHRFILGLYRVLESLHERFPKVLFEGCSGGGGRFDAGMMYYTPQIWCSDNTDAINRLSIQYGSSFAYPPRTMGAHVSVSPNEQTGRITPLATRGAVAMAGAFGYELDVEKMSEEEKEEVKRQIAFYKEHRALLQRGEYYRLSTPQDVCTAWMSVAEDKSEAILTAVWHDVEANPYPAHVRIPGLKGDRVYTVSRIDLVDGAAEAQAVKVAEAVARTDDATVLCRMSGSAMEKAGLTIPFPKAEGECVMLLIR